MNKENSAILNSKTNSSLFRGQEGEKQAQVYLSKRGFSILQKNWKSRRGEIDLIVKKGEIYYFVEVKFRKSKRYGSGAEAIHPYKQKKMASAVLDYLQKQLITRVDIRFAALIIEQKDKEYLFEFYEFPLDLPTRYY